MKIDFKNINSFKNNFKVSNKLKAKKKPFKVFEANSSNILANYNKSICFKGKSYKELGIDDEFYNKNINYRWNKNNLQILDRVANDEHLYSNGNFVQHIKYLFQWLCHDNFKEYILDLLDIVSSNEDLYKNDKLMGILPKNLGDMYSQEQYLALKKILEDKRLYSEDEILDFIDGRMHLLYSKDNYEKFIALLDDEEILPNQTETLYFHPDIKESFKAFNRTVGFENARKIPADEIMRVYNYMPLLKADSVDKLSAKDKREMLERIIKANTNLFDTSDELRKYFPLLPSNKEEYCSIVSKLAQSIQSIEPFDDEITKNIYSALFRILDKIDSLDKEEIKEETSYLSDIFPVLKDEDNLDNALLTIDMVKNHPEFKELTDSDKRIVLLASIFYNLETDYNNDFYSLKRLNLNEDEKTKLFTLLKNKNWIKELLYSFLNTSEDIQDKLYLLSYDFRFENTFDLSLILSVDKIQKAQYDGKIIFEFIKKIKNEISEFQSSQPFLPVTKFPTASRINQVITKVNKDGSTDIKGIYKDKDGLIIINYNEVENKDWEKIGFKRGTISKGIKTKNWLGNNINTGNIKFFVHGLDENEQLANFEAFNLPSSNALLSVSYAERPESKYRFFKPQGIILDVDNINVHTGGESDSGTGYKKTLDSRLYLIIGDRKFVPSLLKSGNALGSKDKYKGFIQENRNKQFSDIYPVKLRNKLIKTLATLNSRPRRFDREYNEFLITNPKPPMAVYAYSLDKDEKIDNPILFLNRDWTTNKEDESTLYPDSVFDRTKFLREYAISHNIPFVVFGECNENRF